MKLYKILSNHKIIMKDEGWEKSTEKIKFDTILQFGNESNTFFPLIYGVRGSGID